MEQHVIELCNNSELEISFEYDPGDVGSYDEPPSNPVLGILSVKLCHWDGTKNHRIELYGIDDTLFPVDYDMIQHIIKQEIEQ